MKIQTRNPQQQTPTPTPPQPPKKPSVGQKIFDEVALGAKNLAYAQSAVPRFVYPSVFGTAAERNLIWETLDALPMRDAVRASSITVKETLGSENLLGVTRPATGSIALNRTGWGMHDPTDFKYTLVHEVGHTVDFKGHTLSVISRTNESARAPWGTPPNVSEYAGTAPPEDFAESYAEHRLDPERLQRINPDKAEALRRMDRPNFLERLVDRPAFKETGKFVGRALSIHPFVRSGLELGRQVAVLTLASEGIVGSFQGMFKGDAVATADGLLAGAAGAGLAFAHLNPMYGAGAMAALGGREGLHLALEKKASKAGTAAATFGGAVGGAIGGVAGPLGLTYAGYSVAGPIGGTVGLVVGGVLGNRLGSKLGAKAALALVD